MDSLAWKLVDYGMAAILMAAIMIYTWFITTRILPRQHERHLAHLESAHQDCERQLMAVTTDFRMGLKEELQARMKLLQKLVDKLETVDRTLAVLLQKSQGGKPPCT